METKIRHNLQVTVCRSVNYTNLLVCTQTGEMVRGHLNVLQIPTSTSVKLGGFFKHHIYFFVSLFFSLRNNKMKIRTGTNNVQSFKVFMGFAARYS